jgi:hypothetical protein
MDRRSIILVVTLFVLIIVGMFAFAYLKRAEVEPVAPVVVEKVDPYAYITRVDAKHFYIDGTHTFAGEFEMPTACDLVEAKTQVTGSQPESVVLDFNVVNTAETCAAAITKQRFLMQANAAPDAVVTATFMGRTIEVNLIPAAAGETPNNFQLFIKG